MSVRLPVEALEYDPIVAEAGLRIDRAPQEYRRNQQQTIATTALLFSFALG